MAADDPGAGGDSVAGVWGQQVVSDDEAPRYYVDRDRSTLTEDGENNESDLGAELWRSYYVVDSAPGKPYGVMVLEIRAEYPGAEAFARYVCDRLNENLVGCDLCGRMVPRTQIVYDRECGACARCRDDEEEA